MRSCGESLKNSLGRFVAASALVFSGLVTVALPAFATDTGVGVTVCGNSVPAAEVTITQPVNDSVVNQSTVTVRGTVVNATQIEVSIDGQYVSTLAIGQSESSFESDTALPPGTHTIGVKANAMCGGQSASDEVVVTYTPQVEAPSSGTSTPTVVEGAPNPDGSQGVIAPVDDADFVRRIEQFPIIGSAVSVVSDFATAIGLESTVIGGNTPVVTGVARVGVTVAALTSVVMASSLAPVAAQAVPGVSEVFNISSHRSMLYLGWVIRGVGVLALALAYFI